MMQTLLFVLSASAMLWLPIVLLSYLSTTYYRLLGRRTTICLGVIGVPIHELSHLLMCFVMGHKPVRLKLFSVASDGTFGSVEYRYTPSVMASLKNILISLAPIPGGITTFCLVTYLLRPDLLGAWYDVNHALYSQMEWQQQFSLFIKQVTEGDGAITVLWASLSFSILMFCAPSRADFSGCTRGVLMIIGFAIACMWALPEQTVRFLENASPFFGFSGAAMLSALLLISSMIAMLMSAKFLINRLR